MRGYAFAIVGIVMCAAAVFGVRLSPFAARSAMAAEPPAAVSAAPSPHHAPARVIAHSIWWKSI